MNTPEPEPMAIDVGAIPVPLNMEVAAVVMPPSLTRITFGDLKVTTSGTDVPTIPGVQATMLTLDEFYNHVSAQDKHNMAVRLNKGVFTVACFPFSAFYQPKEPETCGKLLVIADAYIQDLEGYPARVSLFSCGDDYLYVGLAPGVTK